MKFKPLHDWAVIKRTDVEEKTSGGIIIPDSAKEKPAEGIVVAIGPGKYKKDKDDEKKKVFVPTSLKPGQKVIFARYMVTEVEIDGEEVTLVREDDILGTIEGTGALTVKKDYALKEKAAQPVVIKRKAEVAPVAAPKKPAKKKTVPKKAKVAEKPASKAKKKAAPKKTVKKAGKKKTKKAVTKKKVAAKKSIAKKKTAKKKAVKKAAKKKTQKKVKKTSFTKRKKIKKRK